MSDNLFLHNETFSALEPDFVPTEAPYGVAPSPKAAPALSVMYVIPYLLFIVFSAGMIFASRLFRCYHDYCRRGRRFSDEEEDSLDGEDYGRAANLYSNHSSSIADYYDVGGEATVVALAMRDRIRLYRRTFDKNKHFHVLTRRNFQSPDESNDFDENEDETIHCSMSDAVDIESTCALHDSDDDIDSVGGIDDEDPCWVYLPMASSSPGLNFETDDYSTPQKQKPTAKKDPDAIYSSHTCETIETATTVSTTNESISNPPLTKVTGTCIICFEKFRVGETVVWSDDTTVCKHVFHEDCMVTNLATHSKRTKRPLGRDAMRQQSAISYSYAENPCPICRRKFCTVKHDDLVMAVLLKSVAVALGEEDEDLPRSHRGSGDASPVANSERSQRIVATSYALASATMGIDTMANISSSHGDELDLTNLSYPD